MEEKFEITEDRTWINLDLEEASNSVSDDSSGSSGEDLSSGTTVAIAIVSTLVVLATVFVVTLMYRKRARAHRPYHRMQANGDGVGPREYGATGDTADTQETA